MWKNIFFLFLLFSPTVLTLLFDRQYFGDISLTATNGGIECAACTVVLTLVEQLSVIHEKEVEQVLDELCGYFPGGFEQICVELVDMYGDYVIKYLSKEYTADDVCHGLEFCTNPTCRLYPSSQNTIPMKFSITKKNYEENPWQWLKDLFNRISKHKPIVDVDGDLFSAIETLRGSSWRGKDCDDLNNNVYPGRIDSSFMFDQNCNGIHGKNEKGIPYEEILCGGTGQKGTIVLGDSAGAHFEIPPRYLTAKDINNTTYSDLLFVVSNEFDWPERSGYTGYDKTLPGVPIRSVYKRMEERNRCNHRDYQNIAVNGCRSGSMASDVVKSFTRNQTSDHPALVFLELIGNDVCSPHHSLDHMTSVPEFKKNIMTTLHYLDNLLPKGSHIVLIGLADGRVLWNSLHNRTHPIGATYAEVYQFLNCLEINPCWVWMNHNETLRNAGSKRAEELSQVYREIIANHSLEFKNFDMAYYDFPFVEIVEQWKKDGGETWQLIEPVDGFHPNQIANALMSDLYWKKLSSDHPEFIGSLNPNNQLIQKLFGDQGGY